MKLTICNSHEFRLSRTGSSFIKSHWSNGTYFLFDECKFCGEPFFSKTKGALFCSNDCVNNKQKLIYPYVSEYINSTGYTLLSDGYVNTNNKLLLKCPEGHEYSVIFNNFKLGYRCPICSINNSRHSYDYVKSYIESFNYKLLSNIYENAFTEMEMECDKGHVYKINFGSFKNGKRRCPICKPEKISEKLRHSYDYIKDYINSTGYTLLSDNYRNNKVKLLVKCPEGHEYSVKFGHFRRGVRCSVCNSERQSSKQEQDLQLFVGSFGIPIIKNDRTQIVNPTTGRNLELDIWIPSMKKAIEYNGTYWHSIMESKYKDKIKVEQCRQLGIDLLVISEYNWINSNEFERRRIERWLLNETNNM